jgi:hypothetical protein
LLTKRFMHAIQEPAFVRYKNQHLFEKVDLSLLVPLWRVFLSKKLPAESFQGKAVSHKSSRKNSSIMLWSSRRHSRSNMSLNAAVLQDHGERKNQYVKLTSRLSFSSPMPRLLSQYKKSIRDTMLPAAIPNKKQKG